MYDSRVQIDTATAFKSKFPTVLTQNPNQTLPMIFNEKATLRYVSKN
jgi:hypothetical protein